MASITINSNIASLNAQRRFASSTSGLRSAYASLSSGLRINQASDDAAGLAISTSLTTDRKVYEQGRRNLNDGIALLSIADGALEQLSNIVVRLAELAEQSSNGALQAPQRKALDSEAQALRKEYNRVAQTAQFNGLTLLSGSMGNVSLQTGFGSNSTLQSDLGGAVGTGTFQSAVTDSTITGATANVIAADFNGDGFADILNYGTSGINVRFNLSLGDGQGSFATATSYSVSLGGSVGNAVAGDLNNDGILDIVVGGDTTLVFLGNGNGSFRGPTSFTAVLNNVYTTAIGDLNNDGIADVVLGGDQNVGYGGQVVMFGNGNGTFRAGTSYENTSVSYPSVSTALGDVNGDGFLDMVSAYDFQTMGAAVDWRLNDGTGRFGAESTVNTADIDGGKVLLADINNDNQLDWIQYAQTVDSVTNAYIGLGNGNGTFRSPLAVTVNDGNSSGALGTMQVADFNGDGNLDIFGESMLLFGNGNGTFAAPRTVTQPSGTIASAVADINIDGVIDLLSGTSSGRVYHALQSVTSGTSALLDFSLSTLSNARQALPMFQQKLAQLAAQRGKVGAFESRIGTAFANTTTLSLNVEAAASQISNVDVAQASADLLKQEILQQVGVAILAQANQGPSLALRLLQE